MFRKLIAGTLVLPVLVLVACSNESAPPVQTSQAPAAPSAADVLDDVVAAMGAENLSSITFSGRAWRIRNGWMQTPSASPPWPWRDEITNYRRTIDLTAPASRATGETFASNIFLDPPTAGTYNQNIRPDQTGWSQQLEIWLTPWGFLQG
ncbi:MAG: hypothetical protein R3305_04890, partial [Gammaproteobacteria bacterium]|nr:hypothetical protein [Gammaproteobacteria bacterium]